MKKIILLFTILSVSVLTTACINNFAIQELNNKAVQYMDNGDSETAICRLKSSLDLDDEMYQTHYNLAIAYNNTGNYEEAVKELKKVLELKPDFHDAVYTMAVAKEAIAAQIIDKTDSQGDKILQPTSAEMQEYNNKISEVIDLYNQYLVKKVNADEEKQINEKIKELNMQMKEFSLKLEQAEQKKDTVE